MTATRARRAPVLPHPRQYPVAAPTEFPRIASTRSRAIKRTFDVVFGTALLILSLPLVVLVAVAVLIESGRPVFFGHDRIGREGRSFRLWKFRTMDRDGDAVLTDYLAENPEAALEWERSRKLRIDPRVTRLGRFLRRTSLDELPQLWNVLRGEMSLAGPRPIVTAEIPNYGIFYPLYILAYPGLTGLWQVSGRNDTGYRKRVELDCAYVRNWTPVLDLKLLWKTVRVVLRGKGAY